MVKFANFIILILVLSITIIAVWKNIKINIIRVNRYYTVIYKYMYLKLPKSKKYVLDFSNQIPEFIGNEQKQI